MKKPRAMDVMDPGESHLNERLDLLLMGQTLSQGLVGLMSEQKRRKKVDLIDLSQDDIFPPNSSSSIMRSPMETPGSVTTFIMREEVSLISSDEDKMGLESASTEAALVAQTLRDARLEAKKKSKRKRKKQFLDIEKDILASDSSSGDEKWSKPSSVDESRDGGKMLSESHSVSLKVAIKEEVNAVTNSEPVMKHRKRKKMKLHRDSPQLEESSAAASAFSVSTSAPIAATNGNSIFSPVSAVPKTKRRKGSTSSVGTSTTCEILTPTAGTIRIKTERFEKEDKEEKEPIKRTNEQSEEEVKDHKDEVHEEDQAKREDEVEKEDDAEDKVDADEAEDKKEVDGVEEVADKKEVVADVSMAEINWEGSRSPLGASVSSESDRVVTQCSAAAATAIVLSLTSSTVSSPMLTSGSPSSFSLPMTKEGALQTFSISNEVRLVIAPTLLKAGGSSRGSSSQTRAPNGFIGQQIESSVSAVHQEVSTVVRHLQEQEWSRSRQLVKDNYRRALQSWRHQHDARLSGGTVALGSKRQCTGPTIKKILAPQRLVMVGSFQPQRNRNDDQYLPPRETANSVSQRVTANHIESFPSLVSHARKEKIRSVLNLDGAALATLRTSLVRPPREPALDPQAAPLPVFNSVIPYVDPIPFAWAWVPIAANVHADDEVILRSNPYFGDDDIDGVDTSHFEQVPGELEREIMGESEELALFYLLDVYKHKGFIFEALEAVLNITVSEIKKAHERIKEGRWYREAIMPLLTEAGVLRQNKANGIENDPAVATESLVLRMHEKDKRKEAETFQSCGQDPALWDLLCHDPPSFQVDNPTSVRFGIGVGLGVPNFHNFDKLVANYRGLFCRRCYHFACPEHNVEHPPPIIRRDPLPPFLCPVSHLSLPTDHVRAHLRPPSLHQRVAMNVSLEAFQLAQKNDDFVALQRTLSTNDHATVTSDSEGGRPSLSGGEEPVKRQGRPRKRPLEDVDSVVAVEVKKAKVHRPDSSFVDSLYLQADGTVHWLQPMDATGSSASATKVNPLTKPTPAGASLSVFLAAGPQLLERELQKRDASLQRIASETAKAASAAGEQPDAASSAPPSAPSEGPQAADESDAAPGKKLRFSLQELPSYQKQLLNQPVWKSRIHAESLHIRDETPDIPIVPRSLIAEDEDLDELELYLREFQKAPQFKPPLTDLELAITYKALRMYQNSPPRSMTAAPTSGSESAAATRSTGDLDSLIAFVQALLGTRTYKETRCIVTRKTAVLALRHRAQKLEQKEDSNASAESWIWTNIDDDVDKVVEALEDILALLPPLPVDLDAKIPAPLRPSAVKNCFKSNYQPCNHPGPCSKENQCVCVEADTYCEKFCACGPNCRIKVQGCKCKSNCRTKSCPCFAASRACDPDLCGSCGASIAPWFRMDVCTFIQKGLHQSSKAGGVEVDDADDSGVGGAKRKTSTATNGHSLTATPSLATVCSNVSFSHRPRVRVYVGRSNIHGWGAFAGQRIEKGDFIAEYTGELITQAEAERRGIIYDKYKSSYIFEANMYECIDATRKGNHARFFNHVRDEEATVVPRIMKMNGDHRIGMFAKTTIEPGQELTFNYGYTGVTAPEWAHRDQSGDEDGVSGDGIRPSSQKHKDGRRGQSKR